MFNIIKINNLNKMFNLRNVFNLSKMLHVSKMLCDVVVIIIIINIANDIENFIVKVVLDVNGNIVVNFIFNVAPYDIACC